MQPAIVFAAAILLLNAIGSCDTRSSKPLSPIKLDLVQQETSVNVIAFGDFGSGYPTQAKAAAGMRRFCQESLCQVGFLLGDNFYPDGVKSSVDPLLNERFEGYYRDLKIPFYAVLGNHDYRGNIYAQIEYSALTPLFNMPDRYYQFDLRAWHRLAENLVEVFAIDTQVYLSDAKQQQWLEERLSSSTAIWKVVLGHHPLVSYGKHGHALALKEKLLPLLCQHADIYLSGHDHDLQHLDSGCRTDLLISGAAGKIRPVGSGKETKFAAAEAGFLALTFREEAVQLKFVDGSGQAIYQALKQK